MKVVSISGSTKGEYLTDSSFIKFELKDWNNVYHPVLPSMVLIESGGVFATNSNGTYKTGGDATIPAYGSVEINKPAHWHKHLLIPDEYIGYRIYADCPECDDLEQEFGEGYRNMIMSGSFDNDPVPSSDPDRPR